MNKWTRLGLIGVASYLVFLVLTIPASRAYPIAIEQFGKVSFGEVGDLKLYEISGTIWNGRANVATLGSLRIEPFTWELSALSLITGSISADIYAKSGKNKLSGIISHSLLGNTSIEELNVDLQLDSIDDSLRTYQNAFTAITVGGKIRTSDASFEFDQNMLTSADAQITWIDGGVKYRAGPTFKPAQLGSYVINLTDEDDGIRLKFIDKGGAVKANGGGLIKPTGEYQLTANISPQANASSDIKNSMQFIGVKQPDGSFLIEYAGSYAAKEEQANPPPSNPS